jgi:hypothetical protein
MPASLMRIVPSAHRGTMKSAFEVPHGLKPRGISFTARRWPEGQLYPNLNSTRLKASSTRI